ncbi:hypothetical protein C5167_009358 [Papaver somniferum]|uniref:Ubiquitin-like protease family profile domain-containing protein n=1 Tax=Papaver somniferum TaxID=3469 RepID=A0A4Y7K128_PAPSO|nr:hypothetical protein C5167_009358 [Papaver somniferum]
MKRIKQKAKNEEVYKVKDVKLKAVENLKIMKVLDESQRPLVSRFFRSKTESYTAWENKEHQLIISGRMLDLLMRKGDVGGDIIEFYILKLQKNILKEELKPDGNPKYKKAVFLSTFAYEEKNVAHYEEKKHLHVCHSLVGDGVDHWTLLDFDTETAEFSHYNSLASIEEECRKSDESMRQRIISAFAQHDAKLPRDEQTTQPPPYTMHTPSCCQQMGNDCGLHVCYYMKILLKENMASSPGDDISLKVHEMRPKMVCKILLDA